MTNTTGNANRRLIIPALGGVYASLGDLSETILRVVAGLALVTHGYGKIMNPLGATGMVESLGFYPGAFWAVLLAITEFFGGLFIAAGFLTRPFAAAATFVLGVTVYFHWIVQGQGWAGAEKSVIWMAIFLFFAVRGANRYSVDAKIGREF